MGFGPVRFGVQGNRGLGPELGDTYGLHCSSFLGLPYEILSIYLVKPKKGTTMETMTIGIALTQP